MKVFTWRNVFYLFVSCFVALTLAAGSVGFVTSQSRALRAEHRSDQLAGEAKQNAILIRDLQAKVAILIEQIRRLGIEPAVSLDVPVTAPKPAASPSTIPPTRQRPAAGTTTTTTTRPAAPTTPTTQPPAQPHSPPTSQPPPNKPTPPVSLPGGLPCPVALIC